jgi:hypothetical protein
VTVPTPRPAQRAPDQRELRLVPFSFWLPDPQLAAGSSQRRTYGRAIAAGSGDPSATSPSLGTSDRDHFDACEAAARPPQSSARSTPSLPLLQQAMADQLKALGYPGAEPLRWAISGVDPQRGLRLEGLGVCSAADRSGELKEMAVSAEFGPGRSSSACSSPVDQA